jgi:hypothetical protein
MILLLQTQIDYTAGFVCGVVPRSLIAKIHTRLLTGFFR